MLGTQSQSGAGQRHNYVSAKPEVRPGKVCRLLLLAVVPLVVLTFAIYAIIWLDMFGVAYGFAGGLVCAHTLTHTAWQRKYNERFGQELQDKHDRQRAYWRNGAVGEFPN